MLDETKELNLYTFNVGDAKAFPVEGTMLRLVKGKDSFDCIPRALEIISRYALFCDGATPETAVMRVDDVLDLLRDWCGFSGENDGRQTIPGMEKCHEWMKGYIKAYCDVFFTGDERTLTRAWNKRKKALEAGMFAPQGLSVSDANAITFEASVARALRKGPLKRWCMVGRLAPGDACTTSERKKDGSFKKVSARNAPTILVLTAMCLMELDKGAGVPESGFVPINLRELSLWLGRGKEFDRDIIESWRYDGEQLFVQSREQSGVKPWKISQAWLDDGQWQLIDVTEGKTALARFCEEHEGEGFRCYMDADYDAPGFETGNLKKLVSFSCDEYESCCG